MNSKDYQKWATTLDRIDNGYIELLERLKDNPGMMRLIHMSMGMAGETGEAVDIVKKAVMYNTSIDRDKLLKEFGDILWYMGNALEEVGSSFEEVMQMNHDKLSKRFSNGSFSEKEAIERKDMK